VLLLIVFGLIILALLGAPLFTIFGAASIGDEMKAKILRAGEEKHCILTLGERHEVR